MTDTTAQTNSDLSNDDPLHGFTIVTTALEELIAATPQDALANPTPCSEFDVSDLLDHIVMVMRRVAAVGRGEHWSSVEQDVLRADHLAHYRNASHDVHEAWKDPAQLEAIFEVPWGMLPGAPVILGYTGELAVHAWDLATATGRELVIEDDALRGALFATMQIPAEGRDSPELPFDPVVDPGEDAPVLLQIAGWVGRRVI